MNAALRQEQLEQHAKDRGAQAVRRQIEDAHTKKRGAETPAGVALMKRGLEPLSDAIKATIMDANSGKAGRRMTSTKFMEMLPPDVLAYFTMKAALSTAISRLTVTSCATDIGALVEEELRLSTFEGAEPNLYNTIMRSLAERGAGAGHARRVFVFAANKSKIELPTISRGDKLHLGMKLIELFIETTGFVELVHTQNGKKTRVILRATEKVGEWIDTHNIAAELMRPRYMPTVVRPRPWGSLKGGGYHSNALRAIPLVKRVSKGHTAALGAANLSDVMRPLNAIQETGWRINTTILSLLKEAMARGMRAGLPNAEDLEVPNKPASIAHAVTKEEWQAVDPVVKKAWKVAARGVHEANAASRGKRLNLAMIVAAADELKDDAEIFFPHQLDFRGRAYAVPVGLNPQGPDVARALLLFAEGKPINDARAAGWLAIHGANLYGYDKADFVSRIDWVHERHALITATAAEPFSDMWWADADKPWSFLAWVIEYAAFLEHGDGFVSSFPISVDGSCNGLQHFSAMLRDPIGGAAVNLTPNEKPADIYQRVADRVIEKMRNTAGGLNNLDGEAYMEWMFAHGWLAFGIDRKVTKRPVMVLPYGGTFRSCMGYVREAVSEKIAGGKENPFGEDLPKATSYLAKLVWESISDVVVAARTAMTWLQQVARVASKHGLPLTWSTPSGFVAHQAYRDVKARKVKTRLQGSLVYLTLLEETDKLDAGRQSLGISPNYVHSLDAAAMMQTISLALDNGVTQFAMIHDSYGTVAADMDTLAACLREAFVAMYRDNNVLEQFLAGLPEEVRAECPPVPLMGSLDLEGVLQSEFFFA